VQTRIAKPLAFEYLPKIARSVVIEGPCLGCSATV
jgi:hypothetical protein